MPEKIGNTGMRTRGRETLAANDSGEKGSVPSSRIDVVKIADKVYRLMQSDLILERERTD